MFVSRPHAEKSRSRAAERLGTPSPRTPPIGSTWFSSYEKCVIEPNAQRL